MCENCKYEGRCEKLWIAIPCMCSLMSKNKSTEENEMTKRDAKIGAIVQLAGRSAEIIKVRGDEAKIKPAGESSRWAKISELSKA